MKAIDEISEVYSIAMNDSTFVDRTEAAFSAADGEALGIVWRQHGVHSPVDGTREMREEATKLRIAAIGF